MSPADPHAPLRDFSPGHDVRFDGAFGGLGASKADDRRAVAAALGRLWHRALAALLLTELGG